MTSASEYDFDNRNDPANDAPESNSGERLKPTYAEPLLGLRYLSKVALVGRSNIIAAAAAPVPYVWQDIAVAATIVAIAGGVGEGKTTLLFLILVARMTLGDAIAVLGRVVKPAPADHYVVLIEGEHGEGSTARKLARSCELLGVNDVALDRIIVVARKSVRIGSPVWDDVTALVAAGLVSDIALDTLARVAPADANSEAEQVAIFDLVSRTIDAAPTEADKPIVWACMHRRKNSADGLESVSGSAQRTGQADSVLVVVGEKSGGQVLSSTVTFEKLREEPEEHPTPVTFAMARDANGSRSLRVTGCTANDAVPLEQRILELLALGSRTKNALAAALKRSAGDVDDAIGALFAARHITTVEVQVRGRTRKSFTLRTKYGPQISPDVSPDSTFSKSSTGRHPTSPDDHAN